MITKEEALQLAAAELALWQYNDTEGDCLLVLSGHTKEKPYAWVIYWTSKRWHETRDFRYALAGAGPFIIAKHTGQVSQYSSAYSTKSALKEYEEEGQLYGLRITADLASASARLLLKKLLPMSNQALLQMVRDPASWADRGARKRLKKLRKLLLAQGISSEVLPCFPTLSEPA